MTDMIDVHIWSDVACPWCFIGKRRLEKAAALFDGEIRVEYHSFELAPDTPVDFEGSEADFLADHKGMSRDQVVTALAQVTEIAAAEGLSYDFDALRHTKTLLAHQALHHAKGKGLQVELAERLFRAYFEEGLHLGTAAQLAALGAEVGLDAEELAQALASGEHEAAVEEDIAAARAFGIQGVPFAVIDNRYGVSGAQQPEVFLRALERARADRAVAADEAVAPSTAAGATQ